jgi:L-amino acid N-acyltransferase YncA
MLVDRYPLEAELKGGTKVVLRPMKRQDERAIVEFFGDLTDEDRLYLRNDVSSIQVIRTWINNLDYRRVFPLLALVDDKVVGNGTLHRKPYNWMRHMGEVRVVVSPDFRKLGLGKVLASELLANAEDEGLVRLSAEVVINQKSALELFTRIGFSEEATLKGYVQDAKGQQRDLIVMSKDIE